MASKSNPNDPSFGTLQQLVSIGTLIKTLCGFFVAVVLACLSAYDHFAKSKELEKVNCQLNHQTKINNQQINASNAISAALGALNTNLKTPNPSKDLTKNLAEQISITIVEIKSAMDKINSARENASVECEQRR